jgi:hypothetical protein
VAVEIATNNVDTLTMKWIDIFYVIPLVTVSIGITMITLIMLNCHFSSLQNLENFYVILTTKGFMFVSFIFCCLGSVPLLLLHVGNDPSQSEISIRIILIFVTLFLSISTLFILLSSSVKLQYLQKYFYLSLFVNVTYFFANIAFLGSHFGGYNSDELSINLTEPPQWYCYLTSIFDWFYIGTIMVLLGKFHSKDQFSCEGLSFFKPSRVVNLEDNFSVKNNSSYSEDENGCLFTKEEIEFATSHELILWKSLPNNFKDFFYFPNPINENETAYMHFLQ